MKLFSSKRLSTFHDEKKKQNCVLQKDQTILKIKRFDNVEQQNICE